MRGSPEPVEGRCGSLLAHTGKNGIAPRYCMKWPYNGAARGHRCNRHGGKSPVGIAHPRYGAVKYSLPGEYSKHLPARRRPQYDAARTDPERTALLHEIGLLATRQGELTQRLDPGDLAALWLTQRQLWQQFRAQHDADQMRQTLGQLEALCEQGANDMHLWREIVDISMKLATLRTQEHKRLHELQTFWGPEQVAARWGQFLHALWETCNEQLKGEFSGDLRTLIRPLLVHFQDKIRGIDVEFMDVTPKG